MTPVQKKIAELFYPLTDFYARHDIPLPRIEPLAGDAIPAPYRALLVHDIDMTRTLEAFWNSPLVVRVIEKHVENAHMTRQVVLQTHRDGHPAEFGAIRIHTGRFSPEARTEIIDCRRPLGTILSDHGIPFTCRPNAYFSVACDVIARRAFDLTDAPTLYGRHNLLVDDRDELLAEVVEILPPIETCDDHAR